MAEIWDIRDIYGRVVMGKEQDTFHAQVEIDKVMAI